MGLPAYHDGLNIDWSINFGTILHLLGLVGAVITLYVKLTARMIRMEAKLDILYRDWEREQDNGTRPRPTRR